MPGIKIIQKRIGYSNAILIKNGQNSIIVDTGVSGGIKKLKMLIAEAGLTSEDVKLIVLTHTHYDHTGNLHELVEYTGAPVLVHKNEFKNLESGFTQIPVGNGKYSGLISKLGRKILPRYASPKPFSAQLINHDIFHLDKFGIEAKIISTPGHTNGSQSILIDDMLISGDTFINTPNGRIFPPFADEPEVLLKTWEKLFEMEITCIYPGHGKRFKTEQAFSDYKRWKKKLSKVKSKDSIA